MGSEEPEVCGFWRGLTFSPQLASSPFGDASEEHGTNAQINESVYAVHQFRVGRLLLHMLANRKVVFV